MLLCSVQNKRPIRVIRSFNAVHSVYAPRRGYRYDGLYEAIESEPIDLAQGHHKVLLKRLEGQDPIRYRGVE
jgi:hypothetical protein